MADCNGRCSDLGLAIDESECDCTRCSRGIHVFDTTVPNLKMWECIDCGDAFTLGIIFNLSVGRGNHAGK